MTQALKAKKPAAKKALKAPVTPKQALKKFHITAVIPTVQYGNIQPEYEVEAVSFEEAHAIALPYIENLWARYCAKGSELKVKDVQPIAATAGATPTVATTVEREKLTSRMTGGSALFDETGHTYVNEKGESYLGGSTFAKQFVKPFEKDQILEAMEAKYGVPKEQIAAMWKLKGDVSSGFGTALHGALELYGKFKDVGEVTGANKKPAVNSALHDHPILQKVVEEFYAGREKEVAFYEEFIEDSTKMLCGQLDRVLIVSAKNKICRVQDFKTNADVNKKGFNGKLLTPFNDMPDTPLSGYWIQLSFYAEILKTKGWTVEALDIFAYDSKWTTYTREPIDLVVKGVL